MARSVQELDATHVACLSYLGLKSFFAALVEVPALPVSGDSGCLLTRVEHCRLADAVQSTKKSHLLRLEWSPDLHWCQPGVVKL